MHLEFVPTDAPDPADPDVQFGDSPAQITTELLGLCEQFLRQGSPIVHTELREFLTEQGYYPAALGWFIDALGFATLGRTGVAGGASPSREQPCSIAETAGRCADAVHAGQPDLR